MKPFRNLSFILAFSLFAGSCAPAGHLPAPKLAAVETIRESCSLRTVNETRLFRASVDVFGRHFSGLVLVKPMDLPEQYRILFISELGLSLLDMEYRDGEFSVVSVQEFLNRRRVLGALQQDFHALLLDLSTVKKPRISHAQGQSAVVTEIRFRDAGSRYMFRFPCADGSCRIRRSSGFLRGSEITVEQHAGTRVFIEHKMVKVVIEMKELDKLPTGTNE